MNNTQIEGKHEDYSFVEGPAPIGAKTFGFDASGQFDAKIACIIYSGTIPNPLRGIDIRGNYWCASGYYAEMKEKKSTKAGERTQIEAELVSEKLSDGSVVWNVALVIGEQTIIVNMLNHFAAESFVEDFNHRVSRGHIVGASK